MPFSLHWKHLFLFCKLLKLSRLCHQQKCLIFRSCHCVESDCSGQNAGPSHVRTTSWTWRSNSYNLCSFNVLPKLSPVNKSTVALVIPEKSIQYPVQMFFPVKLSKRAQVLSKFSLFDRKKCLPHRKPLQDEFSATHGNSLFLMVYHDFKLWVTVHNNRAQGGHLAELVYTRANKGIWFDP